MASGRKPMGFRVVGKAHRKVDATAKVTGVTRFADDLFLPRMLFAKLLRSPHPHARIRSIDASRAAALPGVKAVLTGKDLPIPFGILPVSQDEHALALDKVRFVGDPVAAVAATTEEAAAQALDLMTVDYEVLRAFPDALDAVEHPEPAIHDYADAGNIHKLIDLEFGDVEAGLAQADIVREGAGLAVPFAETWSCYKGGARHCGRCGTCVERREAFHLAGVADPTSYDDADYWLEARRAYLARHPA